MGDAFLAALPPLGLAAVTSQTDFVEIIQLKWKTK
jgi:hypothetical protein